MSDSESPSPRPTSPDARDGRNRRRRRRGRAQPKPRPESERPEKKPQNANVPDWRSLHRDIDACMMSDRHRLRGQLKKLKFAVKDGKPFDRSLSRLQSSIEASKGKRDKRVKHLPKPAFPDHLPVVEKKDEIAKAIQDNQVVVICGETGSGKTTQLPKICLEIGRGVDGVIGHTQPRRIAARSVSTKIAEELNTSIGHSVGFKIRFQDKTSPNSYIKVMTDGILLAETQNDRFLEQYDTIIIDEAHERSLNIDFLLGFLKQLLPKRPDLKLIITSATIDPERFSKHFSDAPIINVSGRTYPVDVVYRPIETDDEDDSELTLRGIVNATKEAMSMGPGDILIFLEGEREIRETAEALAPLANNRVEILPLYARLSAAEQNKIFKPHKGCRIVLSTNVAETSLTVPGIRYVIDPGYARISRYSTRTKVQRLPIERVSQASANQRTGRCGRVSAGVCFRLYSEEDFESRDEFTDPEILRTNLASVILQMKALRLGDLDEFPFVEPPERRMVRDGYQTLLEIGAVDDENKITKIGRELSRLPIDPKIGRMLIAANEENCLTEMLILTSALSIQDPRDRPMDKREAADKAHEQFKSEDSDFETFLKLWHFFAEQSKKLSHSKIRKCCRQNFLSYIRMREWCDVHQQLTMLSKELGYKTNDSEAKYDAIHRAVLSGLLGNVGLKTEAFEYTGARAIKFHIFPGSALFKKNPKWVVAGELISTTRLYAHDVARIQPEWIERLATHLVQKTYFEPRWDEKTAHVMANERVTLYGLVIVPKRRVHYGPVNPKEARQIFIHHALVEREFQTEAPFYAHNLKLIEEIKELEAKGRARDVLVEQQIIHDFYDKLIPPGVTNGPQFEKWRKQVEREAPQLLFMSRDTLMLHDAEHVTEEQFPDHMNIEGTRCEIDYHFEPGHPEDGVTLIVPLTVLNQVPIRRMDWLVPGLLKEKIVALIKSLPKQIRVNFVPAPNYADACMQALTPDDVPLTEAIGLHLGRVTGIPIPLAAWQPNTLPIHLTMNYRVIDEKGKILGSGRDLLPLRQRLGSRAKVSFDKLPVSDFNRDDVQKWDFGDLPERVEVTHRGMALTGYPTLVDQGDSVSLKLMETKQAAEASNAQGVRRLCLIQHQSLFLYWLKQIPNIQAMCLHHSSIGSSEQLKLDIIEATVDHVFLGTGTVRTESDFNDRITNGMPQFLNVARQLCDMAARILSDYHEVATVLAQPFPPSWHPSVRDMKRQLGNLVCPHFIRDTPTDWLSHFPRYIKGILRRLDKLKSGLDRDEQFTVEVQAFWDGYEARAKHHNDHNVADPALTQFRWMIEEYRVSLFAQELRTSIPVSAKRLEKAWAKIRVG